MDTACSAVRQTLPPPQRAQVMMAMVQRIARMMILRLPRHVDVDELVGAGGVGLAEAYTRRGQMNAAEFEGFASYRIRGAILDQLRSQDPLSRKQRRVARAIDAAVAVEVQRSGGPAQVEEVATRLGVNERTMRELHDANARAPGRVESFPELAPCSSPSPEDVASDRQLVTHLLRLAAQLPEQQKLVMLQCYVEDRSQKEVAAMLGVTESRVSQIHAKAVRSLAIQSGLQPPAGRHRRCSTWISAAAA
jgi:RNA polymerase sigma factor for flagellar operon FliA